MDIDAFDFELPPELIANRPAVPRDSARLLQVAGSQLQDRVFRDLPSLLRPGDLLIFNDTKVIPAQIKVICARGPVDVTLHKRVSAGRWRAFARPARKLNPGEAVDFDGAAVSILAKDGGEVELDFGCDDDTLRDRLARAGDMPLPPYIAKQRAIDDRDREDYQTIFAARDGAVAAPTAALHFTPELMSALTDRGIDHVTVTLHVGAGTFLPVKVQDTDNHVMHSEWGEIDAVTAGRINAAERVVAVGTTSLRLLESAAGEAGVSAFRGDTDLFITPGYRFRAVDGLITNFHLPKSTLFMLVSAFAGVRAMHAAYEHAKRTGYRFYSYGDASLLWPAETA